MTALVHEPGCTGERVERYSVEQPSGMHARMTRCLDCGAQDGMAMANLPPLNVPNPTSTHPGPWSL